MSIGTVIDPPRADDETRTEVRQDDRPPRTENETRTVVRHRNRLLIVRTAIVLAVGLGIAVRLWYLFHQPIDSDEALVGIAAQGIAHGHLTVFFLGSFYGGVEPYVSAGLFAIFGPSALALKATPVLLSAIASLLIWRIVLRLVKDRQVAALAGVFSWVAPLAVVWNSTVERGFRGVTMACGLACLLLALRCLDGRRGYLNLAGLGLFLGVGWWSSPEIVYFLVPVGLVLIGAVVVSPSGHRLMLWAPRFVVVLVGAGVGALPWLWVNIPGFESMRASSFPGGQARQNTGYSGRIETFFHHILPMQTNLVAPDSAADLFHRPLQLAFQIGFDILIVAALGLCIVKGGRGLAIAAGALALPFLVAFQPGTWYWLDGRYGVYVAAFLVLVVAIGCDQVPALFGRRGHRHSHARDSKAARYLMCGLLAATAVLTAISFHQSSSWFDRGNHAFLSNWRDPNAPTSQVIASLESAGVRTGYADYWVAYDLDFLSNGRLAVTTVTGADTNRSQSINRTVEASPRAAWLFVPPGRVLEGYQQFAGTPAILGPASMSEDAFKAKLHALGVSYHVVDAGMIQAVVPSRSVTPKEVGLP